MTAPPAASDRERRGGGGYERRRDRGDGRGQEPRPRSGRDTLEPVIMRWSRLSCIGICPRPPPCSAP
jgi:hypothetical protein